MTNHDEPWRNITNHDETSRTMTNHHEPPRNHHKPSRSLIQNESWYWILDSDWLNSGSHDIFLRILEKNYPEQSRTTTKHHEPQCEPWRTMTNHDENITNHDETSRTMTNHQEPPRNHHEPSRSLIQNEIWYWILDSDWLNSGSHDIFLRILEKNYPEQSRTTTKHHEPLREPWRTMTWTMTNHDETSRTMMNHHEPPRNHHEPSRSLIQNEIWYWILDSDWLNSGSHDIFLRILEKNYPEQSRTTTKHHEPPREPWRTMTNHDETSRTMTKHHEPWRTTRNHHETTTNHHEVSFKMRFDTESWTLIG